MDLVKTNIAKLITDEALSLGFDDIGFSRALELSGDKEKLQDWLNKGYNSGMKYMENHFEKRVNPSLLVDEAVTVITVLKNYYPANHSLSQNFPKIARYAYGNDYHTVIKEKLSLLLNFIRDSINPNLSGRSFVDSAPVLERSWAVNAGLGWIGKNSMLIHKKLGSFVFIGELIVNIDIPNSEKIVADKCGNCTNCIEACPTSAILPNRTVNSNNCISYLTIENKDEIPEKFIDRFNGWIFGCDICQEVCPWNKKAEPHLDPDFYPLSEIVTMNAKDWQNLTPEKFRSVFKKSAIKRTKYEGLKRNLTFAGNSINQKFTIE